MSIDYNGTCPNDVHFIQFYEASLTVSSFNQDPNVKQKIKSDPRIGHMQAQSGDFFYTTNMNQRKFNVDNFDKRKENLDPRYIETGGTGIRHKNGVLMYDAPDMAIAMLETETSTVNKEARMDRNIVPLSMKATLLF